MSGSATFTIVRSSKSMNTPVQTVASVHHLRVPARSGLCMSSVLSRSIASPDEDGRRAVTPAAVIARLRGPSCAQQPERGVAMRVFVAGAGGAIGRQLVPKLVERGHDVVASTRHASKF